jgi:hypothetical protein
MVTGEISLEVIRLIVYSLRSVVNVIKKLATHQQKSPSRKNGGFSLLFVTNLCFQGIGFTQFASLTPIISQQPAIPIHRFFLWKTGFDLWKT